MKQTKKSRRYSFLLDLLMGQHFTSACRAIVSSKPNGHTVMEFPQTVDSDKTALLGIYDFPDYLEVKILIDNRVLSIAKAPLCHGFSIDLTPFEDIDHYLDHMLNAKKRSRLRSLVRRFEQCIEPEYKVFTGEDLTKQDCDSLILRLEQMLAERFHQKQEANYELPLMEFYREVFHSLMLQNKACLYVIYDRVRPISISMNLILGNTLMLFNSAYDNLYSPFGMGHVNMLKNIEWAFDRGFDLVDLGRGDYKHKRRWVNNRYTYHEMKFGYGGSLLQTLRAILGIAFLKSRFLAIQILKFFGVQHIYSFLRKRLSRLGKPEQGALATNSDRTKLLRVKDIDRSHLIPADLFEPDFANELASYLAILHKQRLSYKRLKPYILENKPGQLYVEKEDQYYRVVRDGETEQ